MSIIFKGGNTLKDFNGSYLQDPIIEDVSNSDLSGKMFKFSSGYAVFAGSYITRNGTYTNQGNIALSGDENISIVGLGFTTVLGGSIAKDGFEVNNGIFGTFFGQNGIRLTLFRGDNNMYSNVKVSVIVFGLWR
jgi:hypothetical protein